MMGRLGAIISLSFLLFVGGSAAASSAVEQSPMVVAQSLPSALPSSRLDKILADNLLQVCIWPDYYSISYRDPRSQVLQGIDIDMAYALADDLGVELEFVNSSFSQLIDDLLEERCDVAMFGVGIIPEREQKLVFTRPHLVSDVLAITTKTNNRINSWADLDQPGNVIAVAKGTLHEPLLRRRLQHATLITPDTPKAREQEVLSGRADAFITDFPYTLRMLETTDWARLVEPDSTYHLTYYSWALKPGDPIWHYRLEDFMRTVKEDGRLLEAARKYRLEPALVLD